MSISKLVSLLKANLFLILIIVLAILPRFIAIDKVPNAINQDELHYALDARSFFLTGKDVLGKVTPLSTLLFNSPQSEPLQAELQYFVEMPTLGLMGLSMMNLALPNALLGVLTVILIYLITQKLFGRNAAVFAGLIAAINPWFIFLSRTAYEMGTATLLFLCVFYLLLVAKGWKILWAIPFALLAFYSYIGTKLIFIPFIFLSILYAYLYVNNKKYLKQYALLFIFACVLTIFFLFQLRLYSVDRASEVLLPNNPEIIRQVIGFRKAAIPNPLMNVFDNKLSIYLLVLIKNTFNTFSSNYLFVNADYFFMTGSHGLFYFIDVIFLVAGSIWVFLSKRKLFSVLAAMIFLGALPEIFHDPNGNGYFTPHISLMIPFLIIVIGVGIDKLAGKFNRYRKLFISVLTILYLILFANFLYIYFFKFPLQEATFEAHNRVLSKYISLNKANTQITVFTENPKLTYREYIFYSNSYNKNTAGGIDASLKEDKFSFNNISFVPCNYTNLKDLKSIIISNIYCSQFEMHPISIAQFRDSGIRYNIYNDRVCNKFGLKPYISDLKLSDFDIENLSPKKFCETFIMSR